MSDQIFEKYNLNHYKNEPTGDDFVQWMYRHSDAKAPEVSTNAAWERLKEKTIPTPVSRTPHYAQWIRIAAAVTLLAVVSILGYRELSQTEMKEVVANEAKQLVVFPDGSRVTLNQHAVISYPERFDDERRIQLQGEAFFEVSKNEKPFIVDGGKASIKVLGTAFNVEADEKEISVFVDHGLVAFSSEKQEVNVSPGKMARWRQGTDEITFDETAPLNLMSWMNGSFVFEDTELGIAAQELGEYYNVEFVVPEHMKQCRITVSFEKESLSRVLRTLKTILQTDVSRKGSTYTFEGKGC